MTNPKKIEPRGNYKTRAAGGLSKSIVVQDFFKGSSLLTEKAKNRAMVVDVESDRECGTATTLRALGGMQVLDYYKTTLATPLSGVVLVSASKRRDSDIGPTSQGVDEESSRRAKRAEIHSKLNKSGRQEQQRYMNELKEQKRRPKSRD